MVAENRMYHSLSVTPTPPRNVGEFLRDLGGVLRWRMRHTAGARRAILFLQSLRWEGRLAFRFTNLRLSVQLRAMVEDWPLDRVQDTVKAHRLEVHRPLEECRTATSKEVRYGGKF
jgi:hypothetical protein